MNSKIYLNEKLIDEGKRLIGLLDAVRFSVRAALWMKLSENQVWNLVIASPEVRINGSKLGYKKVLSILSKIKDADLSLEDIVLIGDQQPMIQILSSALSTGDGISGISFVNNSINGQIFPESYIYRINPNQSVKKIFNRE